MKKNQTKNISLYIFCGLSLNQHESASPGAVQATRQTSTPTHPIPPFFLSPFHQKKTGEQSSEAIGHNSQIVPKFCPSSYNLGYRPVITRRFSEFFVGIFSSILRKEKSLNATKIGGFPQKIEKAQE